MNRKTRLELTWIGKEERPRLEPRILVEEPSRSYHAPTRASGDIFDNMLIRGDNLLALKSLSAALERLRRAFEQEGAKFVPQRLMPRGAARGRAIPVSCEGHNQ